MKQSITATLLAFGLAACAAASAPNPQPAHTITADIVLGVGEQVDGAGLPRNSAAFQTVFRALRSELRRENIRLYDETGFRLDDILPDRPRSTREIIRIARDAKWIGGPRVEIDAAFVYGLSLVVNRNDGRRAIALVLKGRLIDVTSGQDGEEFTYRLDEIPISSRCARDCQLENIGDNARAIARQIRKILVPAYLRYG